MYNGITVTIVDAKRNEEEEEVDEGYEDGVVVNVIAIVCVVVKSLHS